MRGRLAAVLASLLLFSTEAALCAPPADSLIRSLERLENRIEQGIDRKDYARSVQKIRKEFARAATAQKAAAGYPSFRHLEKALEAYEAAGAIWAKGDEKFENPEYQRDHEWFLTVQELNDYARRFPALNDPELRRTEKTGGDPSFSNVYREAAMAALWKEASRNLELARTER